MTTLYVGRPTEQRGYVLFEIHGAMPLESLQVG